MAEGGEPPAKKLKITDPGFRFEWEIDPVCDENGYLKLQLKTVLNRRYRVIEHISHGSFGVTVRAEDLYSYHHVVIKSFRKGIQRQQEALREIQMLAYVQYIRSTHGCGLVKMLDYFTFLDHVFIVLESLGRDLHDFLRLKEYRPIPMRHIRKMAYQLCRAVKALHENSILHGDLKPKNVCIVSMRSTTKTNGTEIHQVLMDPSISIIDFGFAIHNVNNKPFCVLQTPSYRAPEVFFRTGISYASDIWSLGCVLFDLCFKRTLFPIHSDVEYVAVLQEALGPLPEKYAETEIAKKCIREYDETVYRKVYRKPLQEARCIGRGDNVLIFELVKSMITYEPEDRITLDDALQHPFFEPLRIIGY